MEPSTPSNMFGVRFNGKTFYLEEEAPPIFIPKNTKVEIINIFNNKAQQIYIYEVIRYPETLLNLNV